MKTRKQSRKASQIRDCFLKLFPFYRKDGQIKHGKSMKYGKLIQKMEYLWIYRRKKGTNDIRINFKGT